jgi:hypothetical protein
MGPVGAVFLGPISEFLDRASDLDWYHVDLSVFSCEQRRSILLTSTYKSKSRYWTFWALIPLTFVFSKNGPLIYWHGGLYRPLISKNDPQFYCRGVHRPPFAIFWNEHCVENLVLNIKKVWNQLRHNIFGLFSIQATGSIIIKTLHLEPMHNLSKCNLSPTAPAAKKTKYLVKFRCRF